MTSLIWAAYLTDPEHNRQKVILEIKKLLGIAFQEIKGKLEAEESILLGTGGLGEMVQLKRYFGQFGAKVLVTNPS